jgi:SAM-dependent methyltransferase
MGHMAVRKLADTQVQTFADNDYVTPELFEGICAAIAGDFPDGRFAFLDVGGGRGFFADRLLQRFPNAHGTVLDNSEILLSMNACDPRKALLLGSATELTKQLKDRNFDVAFFNLSLHHFVSDSYSASRKLQRVALEQVLGVLASRGRIVVTENLFEGFGVDNFPGFLVYVLTSSKLLAPLVRRLGANTAGCGVCFLSAHAWRREFRRIGLQELAFGAQLWRESELRRRICLRFLGVRCVSRAYFWLAIPQPQ